MSADCLRRENRADWSRLSLIHVSLSFLPTCNVLMLGREGVQWPHGTDGE